MTNEKTTTERREEGARAFSRFIELVENGELHEELTEKLHDLNESLACTAAEFSKAKGQITLVLNFTVERGGVVEVASDVRMKTPKRPKEKAVFFFTKGNNLTLENPRQQKLPLREAPPPPAAREARSEDTPAAKSV